MEFVAGGANVVIQVHSALKPCCFTEIFAYSLGIRAVSAKWISKFRFTPHSMHNLLVL